MRTTIPLRLGCAMFSTSSMPCPLIGEWLHIFDGAHALRREEENRRADTEAEWKKRSKVHLDIIGACLLRRVTVNVYSPWLLVQLCPVATQQTLRHITAYRTSDATRIMVIDAPTPKQHNNIQT